MAARPSGYFEYGGHLGESGRRRPGGPRHHSLGPPVPARLPSARPGSTRRPTVKDKRAATATAKET
jgi:hypothetical protein